MATFLLRGCGGQRDHVCVIQAFTLASSFQAVLFIIVLMKSYYAIEGCFVNTPPGRLACEMASKDGMACKQRASTVEGMGMPPLGISIQARMTSLMTTSRLNVNFFMLQ
uniref:Uncharacterized protein n=1 Tax=Cucumis sativus TaxID=3659 RepID=A0A0A0LVH1_CUCSA